MATESQSATSLGNVEFQGNEFASLLNKEFKPRTEEAKTAVEAAVQTLAQQALSQTALIGKDVIETIQSMIAAIDQNREQPRNRS